MNPVLPVFPENPTSSLYHPLTAGGLVLPGNLFLAPVAGYSDRAFRTICLEQGADFTYTELISAEALSRNPARYGLGPAPVPAAPESALLRRAHNEERYAIQLFGADPAVMYRAASLLAPYGPQMVDINCGCPVPKIIKTGAGSALMRKPALLGRLVEAVVRSSRESLGGIPVSVKLRSGWDAGECNYRECARAALEAGAAVVALHARTRSQGYAGKADWSHIADLAAALPVPLIGSGDLYTPEDAERMLRETGCAAVMFARGALGNPFIFSAARSYLKTGAWHTPGWPERLTTALRQLLLLAEDKGERNACREMRKQFCAYTRGFPGGAGLRNRLVHAETIGEYRSILAASGIEAAEYV
jgi:nifR3 family TIM-barrel protein